MGWYGVRSVYFHADLGAFEERVTIWRASTSEEAIALAEADSSEYCDGLDGVSYAGFSESFAMYDVPENGAEVFSLMRQSALPAEAYLTRFYDTGDERRTGGSPEGGRADKGVGRRGAAERVRSVVGRLRGEREVWVATAHPEHGPHQVPLWFVWHEDAVWMCTSAASATVRNLRTEPRVRLSLPDTADVVLVSGTAACFPAEEVPPGAAEAFAGKFGWDPRAEEGAFVYLRVTPVTVRAWRGEPELRGRTVMRDGAWLV